MSVKNKLRVDNWQGLVIFGQISDMINFQHNFSLKGEHTFGTEARVASFFEFTDPEELTNFLRSDLYSANESLLILGGGSNMLFVNDFNGLVIRASVGGIRKISENETHVWVEAGAGVEWNDLVAFSVENNWGGLENLSLIPGKVGASPVQNIGAYGVEACDCIDSVQGIELPSGNEFVLQARECQFAYRDSIFKHELKNRFVVTRVIFRLNKISEFKLGYGDLNHEVDKLGGPSLKNIRDAVSAIRRLKLPDPALLGNAGSFFTNPVVDEEFATRLKISHPALPIYQAGEGRVKLAAGWLIDQCGWKGYRKGDAGVHEKQALVLVNYGGATGREVYDLSVSIQQSVFHRFGVHLQCEVNIID